MRTATKLGLLSSLYLSQGLPFGFFTQALPVLLRHQGLSLPSIGLAHLLALPWALKFLWAPPMDRHGSARWGRRRGYILPLQCLSSGLLLALALPEGGLDMRLLMAAVLGINLLAATQDVATDGLAVDLLAPAERGWGNGIQVAAYRVGMILGGGVMLAVFDAVGWRPTFLALGTLLLLATVPIALFREPPTAPPPAQSLGLRWWLKRPGAAAWLTLLVVYKAGEALATGMLRTFLVDEGLSLTAIGWLLGGVGFTAGLVGALLGGGLVVRLGRRRALLVFGGIQAGAVLLYALAARGPTSLPLLTLVCGVEYVASGMATAAVFTAMMDACRPDHAATDYTVQASLVVLATGAAAALSGFSAQALGYAGHFTLAALLCAAGTLYAALTFHPPRSLASEAAPEVS
ncbi:siderophore transporter, RhtX/FptX family [Myxococcus xanthus DK 1622]|uniref:Siderophore transporter, RhtX/FptX family n=1 Tax=Myxococcus xanthus (strain DK1622) TaxID=246197 RepID=Q1D1G6_MYXXD|nr:MULTISPECIES: MFS transporter [Myxococcus]ABF91935.1 siderophore transporter, RhtX/FptX family [Myxococcus xanthus DK 1622]NOJ54751.1 MFS transporter [Myxococcus xanthus]QPM77826.1 MFS transporter [Myxococcus xanthus]QVW66894.1 MFS transporter [Myxococcus xanthus DZ2]QZZ53013.1 Anhydromuropeptide permease [Myxococcus xanthus]